MIEVLENTTNILLSLKTDEKTLDLVLPFRLDHCEVFTFQAISTMDVDRKMIENRHSIEEGSFCFYGQHVTSISPNQI